METGLRELITCTRRERRSATSWLLRTQWCLFHLDTQPNMLISKSVPWRPPSLPRRSSIYWYIDQCFDVLIFISTARCSSSRNSLRGITHSPTHPVHILVAVLPPALMVLFYLYLTLFCTYKTMIEPGSVKKNKKNWLWQFKRRHLDMCFKVLPNLWSRERCRRQPVHWSETLLLQHLDCINPNYPPI